MILIGLGANLPSRYGPPAITLQAAIRALDANRVRVIRTSRIWQSAPVPLSDDPWYCNAVAHVTTDLSPHDLLKTLLTIEHDFGRVRSVRNAPRLLDLDLLLYDDRVIDDDHLTIPHPRMHERAFVMLPLRDVAPDLAAHFTTPPDQICMPRAPGPALMGIVNVTPDSFSDGGKFLHVDSAIEQGERLLDEGADILDIGGESTRPGATPIDAATEIARVIPVIEGLQNSVRQRGARLSIDTYRAETMRAALRAGIHMINDVKALTHHPDCADVAREAQVPVILMDWNAHNADNRIDTPDHTASSRDPVTDLIARLKERTDFLQTAGFDPDRLIIDPGIGFGKETNENMALLRGLPALRSHLPFPLMIGASRKRFIAALDRSGDPMDRLGGSLAVALHAFHCGVAYLRVHDVAATRQALIVADALTADPFMLP